MSAQDKTKHTPLPWKQVGIEPATILGKDNRGDQMFTIVADSYFKKHSPEEARLFEEATAEFIVHIGNSHSQLVEALKATLPYIDESLQLGKMIRAALKAAEEQK